MNYVQECDLSELLRLAAKKSLGRGLVLHNSETSSFKAVAGKKVRRVELADVYVTCDVMCRLCDVSAGN